MQAMNEVLRTGNSPGAVYIVRNAPTSLMKELDYGKEYKYAHDYENNFVKQDYLPPQLKNHQFWEAQSNPSEAKMRELMRKLWGKE
jgi:putative ATPase